MVCSAMKKKTEKTMKKLIVGIVSVLAAIAVNAASVSWQSGVVFAPSDANGTLATGSAYKMPDSATAAMYLFAIADSTAYEKVLADGVYATYGSKLGDATASTTSLKSSKFSTLETTGHAASSTAYAAILFTYTDSAGKEWYLENTATAAINDLGGDATVNNLARYIGGVSSNGQLASWSTAAVPEPTSGLLMLMGLAGLALRRKRA